MAPAGFFFPQLTAAQAELEQLTAALRDRAEALGVDPDTAVAAAADLARTTALDTAGALRRVGQELVDQWLQQQAAQPGSVRVMAEDQVVDEAGCSCGWRGAGEDVEHHPCPLPDPQELLDCCEHPRERHYGEYGDGVPRCEFCECSVKSW